MANSGIYEEDYADGSDHESLYADSPSDGYFSQRDHPQETFIENSTAQAESDAKAREAARSSAGSSATVPPSSTSPTVSSRSAAWADESTPLLDAGPAPPDYAAATAHRREEAEARQTPVQSHESHNHRSTPGDVPSYSTLNQSSPPASEPNDDLPWPLGSRNNPFARSETTGEEPPWPLGNRNNPFARNEETGEEPPWPIGSRGNPFGPGFPFARRDAPSAATGSPDVPDQRRSMRDRYGEEVASQNEGWRRRRAQRGKRSRPRWYRRCFRCKTMSIFSVVLALLTIGLVLLLIKVSRDAGKTQSPSRGEDVTTPEKGNNGNGNGDTPVGDTDPDNGGNKPGDSNPGGDKDSRPPVPDLPHSSNCPYSSFTDVTVLDFANPRDFSFYERMNDEVASYFTGGISGQLTIVPADSNANVDVRVSIALATSDPWHVSRVNYERFDDGLHLKNPSIQRPGNHEVSRPCLGVGVTIHVRRGVDIGHWRITTRNMDVQMGDYTSTEMGGYGASMANMTTVTTSHGSVKADYWSSRETNITTTSGSIQGTYALWDSLLLRSVSGSINVRPVTKAADATDPKPASFTATTRSGSVHVSFPINAAPVERDYRTHVESRSSSISGSYILGCQTVFATASGSLTVALLPASSDMNASELYTDNRSGSTNIRVLSPYGHSGGKALRSLYSSHKSQSGSVNVALAGEWEGRIEGETKSGTINIKGEGLEWYSDVPVGSSGRHVSVDRGHGTSWLDLQTRSGSANIVVEDE